MESMVHFQNILVRVSADLGMQHCSCDGLISHDEQPKILLFVDPALFWIEENLW